MSGKRDAFMAAVQGRAAESVEVPGVGTFEARAISGFDHDRVLKAAEGKDGERSEAAYNAALVCYGVYDPDSGQRAFDPETDIPALAGGRMYPLLPLAAAVRKLSFIGPDAGKGGSGSTPGTPTG